MVDTEIAVVVAIPSPVDVNEVLRIISVADKSVPTQSVFARSSIIDGALRIDFALDDAEPLGSVVVIPFAHRRTAVIAEIMAERIWHDGRYGTAAACHIFHINGYSEMECECRDGIFLSLCRLYSAIRVEDVRPVVGGVSEVCTQCLSTSLGIGIGFRVVSLCGITMISHNLRCCRSHTANVIMLGLSAGGVGGTLQIVRSVLSPLDFAEQWSLDGSSHTTGRVYDARLVATTLNIHLVEFHPLAQILRHTFPVESALV